MITDQSKLLQSISPTSSSSYSNQAAPAKHYSKPAIPGTTDDAITLSEHGQAIAAIWQQMGNEGEKIAASITPAEQTYSFIDPKRRSFNAPPHLSQPQNERSTVNINGKDIITSGHAYDTSAAGTFKIMNGANMDAFNQDFAAVGFVSSESEALTQVTSPPHTVTMTGELSTLDSSKSAREQILAEAENLADLVLTERQLRKEFGDDVKLAYDPNQKSYIMLKPGDNFYDSVDSAEEMLKLYANNVNAQTNTLYADYAPQINQLFASKGLYV